MLHDAACASTCSRSSSIGFGKLASLRGPNGPGKGAFQSPLATVCSGGFAHRRSVELGPERLRQRRLEIAVGLVEEDRQRALRTQHARELGQRLGAREPVERLPDEDGIDSAVLERDRVRGAFERLCLGDDALEHSAHLVQGLHREHPRVPRHELARQLAGAGREVEHDGVPRQIDGVERRLRIARSPQLVVLRRAAEASGEVRH